MIKTPEKVFQYIRVRALIKCAESLTSPRLLLVKTYEAVVYNWLQSIHLDKHENYPFPILEIWHIQGK